jgi:hypothetical protein
VKAAALPSHVRTRRCTSAQRPGPIAGSYLDRKRQEGKSTREAVRCLKRHLARRTWHLLQRPNPSKISLNLLT